KHQTVTLIRQSRIVARAFIAQKRVSAIHLVPLKTKVRLFESRANPVASFQRNVWILAAEDMQQLSADLSRALQRIVVHSLAQAALMNVGGVEARCRQH